MTREQEKLISSFEKLIFQITAEIEAGLAYDAKDVKHRADALQSVTTAYTDLIRSVRMR